MDPHDALGNAIDAPAAPLANEVRGAVFFRQYVGPATCRRGRSPYGLLPRAFAHAPVEPQ
jgi:hypothetical protein